MTKEWEDLLTKAEELVDAFQFESARECTEQALQLDGKSVRALQLHAAICIELGDVDTGRQCLESAIKEDPNGSPDAYLALAQLCSGRRALEHYMSGIKIFQSNLDTLQDEDRIAASSAMVAVAELFMTDLCEEEDAEGRCEEALQHAKTVCPTNPEVFRLECDLRLVQRREEEAMVAMQRCLAAWAEAEDTKRQRMSFEFRAAVAKLLIEMRQYEDGETILEQLIDEDDEAYLPWYLLGISCVFKLEHCGDSVDVAEQETAREAFHMAKHLLMREPEEQRDEELLESIEDFLKDLPESLDDHEDDDDADQHVDDDHSDEDFMEEKGNENS